MSRFGSQAWTNWMSSSCVKSCEASLVPSDFSSCTTCFTAQWNFFSTSVEPFCVMEESDISFGCDIWKLRRKRTVALEQTRNFYNCYRLVVDKGPVTKETWLEQTLDRIVKMVRCELYLVCRSWKNGGSLLKIQSVESEVKAGRKSLDTKQFRQDLKWNLLCRKRPGFIQISTVMEIVFNSIVLIDKKDMLFEGGNTDAWATSQHHHCRRDKKECVFVFLLFS